MAQICLWQTATKFSFMQKDMVINMKLIHTADLHLCSKITASLDPEKTAIRRAEILSAFVSMTAYAKENGVRAILISGDLFDERERVVRSTLKTFLRTCRDCESIDFYIISGNHDAEDFSKIWSDIPENVHLFPKDEGFTSYMLEENVCISGAQINDTDNRALAQSLSLDKDAVNIVMLHGMMERSGNVLCKKMFADKNIDYLALGHIHSYKAEKLDKRGIWCYSGCPAGRGFDECGEKGFSLINIENNTLTHEFVRLDGRVIHDITVDATGVEDLLRAALDACVNVHSRDIVSVTLVGEYEEDNIPDTELIRVKLSEKFWYARVQSKMGVHSDVTKYQNVISLKGEFLRTVQGAKLTEAQKRDIIACGFAALSGEDNF